MRDVFKNNVVVLFDKYLYRYYILWALFILCLGGMDLIAYKRNRDKLFNVIIVVQRSHYIYYFLIFSSNQNDRCKE